MPTTIRENAGTHVLGLPRLRALTLAYGSTRRRWCCPTLDRAIQARLAEPGRADFIALDADPSPAPEHPNLARSR